MNNLTSERLCVSYQSAKCRGDLTHEQKQRARDGWHRDFHQLSAPTVGERVAQMQLLKQFSHKRLQLAALRETCQC